MTKASANAGLRITAVLEGAKGVVVMAAGLGLFAVAHRDVQLIAEEVVKHLHLNPAREFPRIFLHLAANLNPQKLWLLAAGATVYSMMLFLEAYGLWHDWKWMKWFAALGGGIYIPAEIGGLLYGFGWVKLIVFGVNVSVVAFLFFQVAFERSRNRRKQTKPFTGAGSVE